MKLLVGLERLREALADKTGEKLAVLDERGALLDPPTVTIDDPLEWVPKFGHGAMATVARNQDRLLAQQRETLGSMWRAYQEAHWVRDLAAQTVSRPPEPGEMAHCARWVCFLASCP